MVAAVRVAVVVDVATEVGRTGHGIHLPSTIVSSIFGGIERAGQCFAGRKFPGAAGHHATDPFGVGAPGSFPEGTDLGAAHADPVHPFGVAGDKVSVFVYSVRPACFCPSFDLVAVEAVGVCPIPDFVGVFQVEGQGRIQQLVGQFSKVAHIGVVGPVEEIDPGVGLEKVGQFKHQLKGWALIAPAAPPDRIGELAAFVPGVGGDIVDDPLPLHKTQGSVRTQRLEHERVKAVGHVDLFEGTKVAGWAAGRVLGIPERIVSADAAGRDQTQVAQMVGWVDIGDADSQQCGLAGVKAQHIAARAAADFGDKGRKVVLDGGFTFVEDSPLAAGEVFGHTVEIGQRHMGKLAVRVVAKREDPAIGVEDELVLFVGVPDVVAGFVALGQPVFGQWGLIDRPQHFALGQFGQVGADG